MTGKEGEGGAWNECFYGRFTRSIPLPLEADPNEVGAELKDGVLTVRLKPGPAAKARKVEVRAG